MAAAGLAESGRPVFNAPLESDIGFGLTGGLDFASAFYFRGYQQGDNGLTLQPYVNLFAACPLANGAVLHPYVGFFNSSTLGAPDGMDGMSDAMLGASLTWDALRIDGKYTYYSPPPAMHLPKHELGVRASFDLMHSGNALEANEPFSLRLLGGVYGGLSDANGVCYFEPGLEPAWRFEIAGRNVGITLPVLCGLGANGYYLNDRGGNATAGYVSAAVTASVALPAPAGCGDWYLNASCQYLHLFADNLVQINNGRSDAFVGKLGIGFRF